MHARTDTVDVAAVCDTIGEISRVDLDELDLTDRLADVGLVGLDLLACVAELECRFGIEFPDDLVAALSTVDDLVHYTNLKRTQR